MPADVTDEFPVSSIPAANVSSVPLRSPLRYPGGKSWLIPHLKAWLDQLTARPEVFVEPFCGGATASLLAIADDYADSAVMIELDSAIATFWKCVFKRPDELCNKIESFQPDSESVDQLLGGSYRADVDKAFRTLIRNRTSRAGIIANGAALLRSGENGRGLESRWYPQTLIRRIRDIEPNRHRFTIEPADGLIQLKNYVNEPGVVIFADPPYTIGNKQPGRRLYSYNDIDHEELFETLAASDAEFLMTYDNDPHVCKLVRQHDFSAVRVNVRTAHASVRSELVITRQPTFA
ncbi:MAG: DNA adenine methylase [Acidimicrobiaceae bacterium]|nr:DNA adenine methylase [Acidimicrobiaceae bacterium]